jgi:hypothetical protein
LVQKWYSCILKSCGKQVKFHSQTLQTVLKCWSCSGVWCCIKPYVGNHLKDHQKSQPRRQVTLWPLWKPQISNMNQKWDFKFSRWWVWCSELSSGMCCHVK